MKPAIHAFALLCLPLAAASRLPYPIVDTGLDRCFDDQGEVAPPSPGRPFHGQDAQILTIQPAFTVAPDGLTATDRNTGLTWCRAADTNGDGKLDHSDKLTWEQALQHPASLNASKFGGFHDWRLPSIKELYSLFDARGIDPSGPNDADPSTLRPFLDPTVFRFAYGDPAAGARVIDAQYASSTKYVGKSPRGGDKVFGVNFADGRIKGYDQTGPGGARAFRFFVLCVRGNPAYGKNDFHDNGDGTVTDRATGLIWAKDDSSDGMDWQAALALVQQKNAEKYLSHDDWRLPDVKELQSIVDYSRSPDTSNSAAIDPLLRCTAIVNEAGQADFPSYWSSTTHVGHFGGAAAMYVAFGRAGGFMPERPFANGPDHSAVPGPRRFVDVHGAGAQRSDPKSGDPKQFPQGRGPQGDVIRILNHVRLVRGGTASPAKLSTTPRQSTARNPRPDLPGRRSSPTLAPSPVVGVLDTNRDGCLDNEEIRNAPAALKSLDKNSDGKLTVDELRPR